MDLDPPLPFQNPKKRKHSHSTANFHPPKPTRDLQPPQQLDDLVEFDEEIASHELNLPISDSDNRATAAASQFIDHPWKYLPLRNAQALDDIIKELGWKHPYRLESASLGGFWFYGVQIIVRTEMPGEGDLENLAAEFRTRSIVKHCRLTFPRNDHDKIVNEASGIELSVILNDQIFAYYLSSRRDRLQSSPVFDKKSLEVCDFFAGEPTVIVFEPDTQHATLKANETAQSITSKIKNPPNHADNIQLILCYLRMTLRLSPAELRALAKVLWKCDENFLENWPANSQSSDFWKKSLEDPTVRHLTNDLIPTLNSALRACSGGDLWSKLSNLSQISPTKGIYPTLDFLIGTRSIAFLSFATKESWPRHISHFALDGSIFDGIPGTNLCKTVWVLSDGSFPGHRLVMLLRFGWSQADKQQPLHAKAYQIWKKNTIEGVVSSIALTLMFHWRFSLDQVVNTLRLHSLSNIIPHQNVTKWDDCLFKLDGTPIASKLIQFKLTKKSEWKENIATITKQSVRSFIQSVSKTSRTSRIEYVHVGQGGVSSSYSGVSIPVVRRTGDTQTPEPQVAATAFPAHPMRSSTERSNLDQEIDFVKFFEGESGRHRFPVGLYLKDLKRNNRPLTVVLFCRTSSVPLLTIFQQVRAMICSLGPQWIHVDELKIVLEFVSSNEVPISDRPCFSNLMKDINLELSDTVLLTVNPDRLTRRVEDIDDIARTLRNATWYSLGMKGSANMWVKMLQETVAEEDSVGAVEEAHVPFDQVETLSHSSNNRSIGTFSATVFGMDVETDDEAEEADANAVNTVSSHSSVSKEITISELVMDDETEEEDGGDGEVENISATPNVEQHHSASVKDVKNHLRISRQVAKQQGTYTRQVLHQIRILDRLHQSGTGSAVASLLLHHMVVYGRTKLVLLVRTSPCFNDAHSPTASASRQFTLLKHFSEFVVKLGTVLGYTVEESQLQLSSVSAYDRSTLNALLASQMKNSLILTTSVDRITRSMDLKDEIVAWSQENNNSIVSLFWQGYSLRTETEYTGLADLLRTTPGELVDQLVELAECGRKDHPQNPPRSTNLTEYAENLILTLNLARQHISNPLLVPIWTVPLNPFSSVVDHHVLASFEFVRGMSLSSYQGQRQIINRGMELTAANPLLSDLTPYSGLNDHRKDLLYTYVESMTGIGPQILASKTASWINCKCAQRLITPRPEPQDIHPYDCVCGCTPCVIERTKLCPTGCSMDNPCSCALTCACVCQWCHRMSPPRELTIRTPREPRETPLGRLRAVPVREELSPSPLESAPRTPRQPAPTIPVRVQSTPARKEQCLSCHKQTPFYAQSLCEPCYNKQYNTQRAQITCANEGCGKSRKSKYAWCSLECFNQDPNPNKRFNECADCNKHWPIGLGRYCYDCSNKRRKY